MATFWNATGTVEALGNSTFNKAATEYSVVKMRDGAGHLFTGHKVVCATNTHADMGVGAHLTLLGFEAEGKHWVFAAISGKDVSEDISEMAAGKGTLIRMGTMFCLFGALIAVTIIGIIVTIALVPHGIRMLKTGGEFPDRAQMDAYLRQHLALSETGAV